MDTLPLAVENIELSLTSKESTFSVRTYRVEHALSTPFDIRVEATCAHDDVDLDSIVGLGASLRMHGGDAGGRTWTGVCAHAEQVEVEPDGLSTYQLRIVPALWRTTHRRNCRIFQHLSLPDIAAAVLGEWKIEVDFELDRSRFPRFEYRVQYGETDFVFLTRILEEAGVSYTFRDPEEEGAETRLVLVAEPHNGAERAAGPLPFVNQKDSTTRGEHCSHVRLAHRVRAGHVTVRDYDFQARPELALYSEARHAGTLDARLEVYEYLPGSACVEAADGASARVDEREARAFAERKLAGERHGRRALELETRCLDLHAGAVMSLRGHPRRDLEGKKLLITRQVIEGTVGRQYRATHSAVFADEPYKPAMVTPKPRIVGVQSALVVGSAGQEIHTDEFGRVRVQFHWDREGQRDEHSSCLIRVSQAWAGRGYGVHAVPRVGDEVLVGFFEGDPDQPVVVGRVHNSASRTPHSLPVHKTRTSWKSESTPGGDGWSEISLDDAKGQELVFIRAERDLQRVVKNDETVTIGASLKTSIGVDETVEIAADQSIHVKGSRTARVEGSDRLAIGESLTLAIGEGGTGASIESGKRIILTTGQASIVLDGPNIYFDAEAAIRLSGGALLQASAGEVHLDGGPNVFINSGCGGSPGVAALGGSSASAAGPSPIDSAAEARLDRLLASPVELPGSAPEALAIPAYVEQQLEQERVKILTGLERCEADVKTRAEMMVEAVGAELRQNLVPRVEACRKQLQASVDQARALVERVKGEAATLVTELKSRASAIEAEFKARVQLVKDTVAGVRERVTALIDGIQERVEQVKAQARQIVDSIKAQITQIKDQIKATFDTLRRQVVAVLQSEVNAVKATIDQAKAQLEQVVASIKTTIDQARAQVQQLVATVKADIQQIKQQAEQIVGEIKADVKQIGAEVKGAIQDAKSEVKGAIGDVKGAIGDVKQEWKDAKGEVKQAVSEARQEGKQIAGEAKQAWGDAKSEAKQAVSEARQEGKQIAGEAKQAWGDAKSEAKQAVSEARQEGKQIAGEAKQAWGDAGGQAREAAAGLPQLPHSQLVPRGGLPSPLPPPRSGILTRPGALGSESVARSVNANTGASYLQSPTDGQMMVMRTQASSPISSSQLSSSVVEHQMNGMSSTDALAAALQQHGYAVYERPWDGLGSEFIKKAVL